MLRGPSSLAVCSWARTFCRHRLRQKAVSPMSAHFPDSETIHTVLSLATRAPSIHYSEPGTAGWRPDQSLHLYGDRSMHLPNTDPDSRDLLLSCGASLHHCVIVLSAFGWQATVHRFPNSSEPEHLAAVEVYRPAATELDVTLAAAIPRRRTDRQLVAGARCRYQLDGRPRGTRGRDVATSRVTSEAARDCG